jgi:hypothetical protein
MTPLPSEICNARARQRERPPLFAAYKGASIWPELDQFGCTFLLTYLLLNLDKKYTPQHPTLPRIAARPQSMQSCCALAALSEPEEYKPKFSPV